MSHEEFGERGEDRLLRAILDEQEEQTKILQQQTKILKGIAKELQPKLIAIEIRFGETMSQGPVTLTPSAKSTKATVLGFDANGAPFTGTIPTVTYAPDVTTFATFAGDGNNGDDITGVADGTTNLGVSLVTAEGLNLTDTSQVITSGFTAPPQVLSSIKLDFSQPQ